MTVWYAVLIVGAFSYACRLVPWLVLDRVQIGPSAEAGLRYAGAGAVTALLVGSLLHSEASGGSLGPLLAALTVSGVSVWRRLPGLLGIALGMGTFLALDLVW